jgi:transposase
MKIHGVAFVGIDTAKARNAVAVAEIGRNGEVRYLGEFDNMPDGVSKLIRKLASHHETLHVCYEAGPTGYGLCRQVLALGHECTVVAPSLIPRRPGDRVKTNRRDAQSLARLLRAGELTAVWVPDDTHEAVRAAAERIERLEAALEEIVPSWTMAPVVAAFQAMRGVKFLTATTMVAEAGDLRRFDHPRQLMAFLGLVPSERSTGDTRWQGGITKTGNAHARKALVEAAWTLPALRGSWRASPGSSTRVAAAGARHCVKGTDMSVRPLSTPDSERQAQHGRRHGSRPGDCGVPVGGRTRGRADAAEGSEGITVKDADPTIRVQKDSART